MIGRFVILGASGDLTSRYLLPALVQLHEAGQLPQDIEIVGLARRNWDTIAFRRHIREKLDGVPSGVAQSSREAVISILEYHQADVANRDEISRAIGAISGPILAYLALPPSLFAPAIEALASLGLPKGSRIVVEKPFGEDLASARSLNDLLHRTFPEQATFRIDHFLGMQTVQNILGLRFANRIFEPVWNCQHVERVEVIWDETRAPEGRASYYDSAGALRDMIQNHLLQLLCFVAMEPPARLNERDLRDRKVEVLRAVRQLSPEEVERDTVRGRYSAGRIEERDVPAYKDEEGVDAQRGTETFAQVTLRIDNWRWAGVPFVLRTGKALGKDRWEVTIHLKPVPHLAFLGQEERPRPNVLRLEMDPDRLALGLNINAMGDPFDLEHIELDRTLAPHEPSPYACLLLNALEGDPTFFIRDDEAEESWRIVEPILAIWGQGRVPLLEYPAGSSGPAC